MPLLSSNEIIDVNIGIHVILTITIVPLSIHLLYKLIFVKNGSHSKRSISPIMKALCCLFSLFYIPQIITNLMTEIYSDGHHAEQRIQWNLSMNVFYGLINICLYSIIILRHFITFKDSAYASSKMLYVFLSFLIILYALVYSSFFIIYANKRQWIPTNDINKVYIAVDVIILAIDIILTFVMTYLFWTKLQRLIIDTYGMTNSMDVNYTESISISRKSIYLNSNQQKLITVATRSVILTLPAMMSSILLWTISTWGWILNDIYPTSPLLPPIDNTVHLFLIPFDIICNFLCIYLNFDFTKKLYKIICCGFDRCCLKCCQWITQTRIVNQQQRNLELSQTPYHLLSHD